MPDASCWENSHAGDVRRGEPPARVGVRAGMLSILRRMTLRQFIMIGCAVAALTTLVLVYRHLDLEAIHAKAESVNGGVVFAAMAVLPLVGFPVSVVHAVAGLRFGLGLGCLLVAVCTLLQLLAAYGLVKLMPGFFERKLEPLRRRIPNGAHSPVTLFTMLLPGVPYFSQIYVLPLIGVPLRTFLMWSLPISVARSIVGVTFGDIVDHLTPLKLAGFGCYLVGIILLCAFAFRKLRRAMLQQAGESVAGNITPLSAPVGGWDRFWERRMHARKRGA